MDKITKVQEVSSFIVNFDNKYWNEVILRLTIIGIRYVTNNYQNKFSWKLKDLNIILEKLEKIKEPKEKNLKNNYINKKESKKEYNYNYNNSSLLKKKESEINSNNNSLLLSEKSGFYNKIKKSKGQNMILKNKNNRNKILSLKQNSFNENNKKINVVVSNFPFHQNNIIKEKEYNKDKIERNKGDFLFYYNKENNDYLNYNKIRNIEKNNFNNNSYILGNVYNSNEEYTPRYTNGDYNLRKNIKLFDNNLKKDDYKNSSREFISELRKMSQNKDYKQNNHKKLVSNIIYHSQPKLNISYSSPLLQNKKMPIKSYYKQDYSFNSREKMDKIKSDILIINKGTDKENNDKSLSKSVNRKYEFKSTNDNLKINFKYGINNDNDKNNLENINKYLKNPNSKSGNMKFNYIKDVIKKNKNEMNFDYSSIKVNNDNSKVEIKYKVPYTDRHSCNYLYEIQQQTNKKNNTESINQNNIEEENKNKENNNLK